VNYITQVFEHLNNPIEVKSDSDLFGGIVVDEKGNRVKDITTLEVDSDYYFLAYTKISHLNPKPGIESATPKFSIKIKLKKDDSDPLKWMFDVLRNGLNLASAITNQGVNMLNIVEANINCQVQFDGVRVNISKVVLTDYAIQGEIYTMMILRKD
jgi:hypothetical protein